MQSNFLTPIQALAWYVWSEPQNKATFYYQEQEKYAARYTHKRSPGPLWRCTYDGRLLSPSTRHNSGLVYATGRPLSGRLSRIAQTLRYFDDGEDARSLCSGDVNARPAAWCGWGCALRRYYATSGRHGSLTGNPTRSWPRHPPSHSHDAGCRETP